MWGWVGAKLAGPWVAELRVTALGCMGAALRLGATNLCTCVFIFADGVAPLGTTA